MEKWRYWTAKTSVWWDLHTCPIPAEFDPPQIAQNIRSALVQMGYTGKVTITAFGDISGIPHSVQEAFYSAEFNLKHISSAWDLDTFNLPEGAIGDKIGANINNRLVIVGFEGDVTLYCCGSALTFLSRLYNHLSIVGFNLRQLRDFESSSDIVITTSIFNWIEGPRETRVLFLITNRPYFYRSPIRALKVNGFKIIVATTGGEVSGLDNIPHYVLSWDDVAMPVRP